MESVMARPKSHKTKVFEDQSSKVLKSKMEYREGSRNVHSIKMKGMASLVGDIHDDQIKAPFGQHLDTEVIEDGFLKPKSNLYPTA